MTFYLTRLLLLLLGEFAFKEDSAIGFVLRFLGCGVMLVMMIIVLILYLTLYCF